MIEQLKIISTLRIQSNTSKEGKTLMKQLKGVYMKQRKRNFKTENTKKHQKRKNNSKMEREKPFEQVQGMSIVDPSIF